MVRDGMHVAHEALVEQARAALDRLASGSPDGQVVHAAIEEIDRAWQRTPFSVGLLGKDISDRTALIDRLCGGALAGLVRADGSATLRVRRGVRDRFRALRDGKKEEHSKPAERPSVENIAALHTHVEEARARREDRALTAAAAEQAIPALAKARPPWWAFWLWPIRWLLLALAKRKLAARHAALAALDVSQHELEGAERAITAVDAIESEPVEVYAERLRELSSGTGSGVGVRVVDIDVASAGMPEGLVVVELADLSRATDLDVIVEVEEQMVYAVEARGKRTWRIGTLAEATSGLKALAVNARAARLGRHAIYTIHAAMTSIGEMLDGAEADFRTRIERLEALRVLDPDAFVAAELARVRPQIIASVMTVMSHTFAHLGTELTELAAAWMRAIGEAASNDELKAAVVQIDEGSSTALQGIAERVRGLVTGGLGGTAHDLYPDLVAGLRTRGLPEQYQRASHRPPPVVVMPSLDTISSNLGGVGNWFTGLFRSLDTKRSEVGEKVQARADHVREVATAELLDAEPRLHEALAQTLGAELATALAHHVVWLEAVIERERAAIERDRKALDSLVRARAVARDDSRRLVELVAQLELGAGLGLGTP